MMSPAIMIPVDVVAIVILVFGGYYRKYRRQDIAIAVLSLNLGVLSVATALSSAQVSVGLGLGLMGVLSIVRLRSTQLRHDEVAYYFSSLALGLIAAFPLTPVWLSPTLMASTVGALLIADHPRWFPMQEQLSVVLGRAVTDATEVRNEVCKLIDGEIMSLHTRRIDFVNDSTVVDIRFKHRRRAETKSNAATPHVIELACDDSTTGAAPIGTDQ